MVFSDISVPKSFIKMYLLDKKILVQLIWTQGLDLFISVETGSGSAFGKYQCGFQKVVIQKCFLSNTRKMETYCTQK